MRQQVRDLCNHDHCGCSNACSLHNQGPLPQKAPAKLQWLVVWGEAVPGIAAACGRSRHQDQQQCDWLSILCAGMAALLAACPTFETFWQGRLIPGACVDTLPFIRAVRLKRSAAAKDLLPDDVLSRIRYVVLPCYIICMCALDAATPHPACKASLAVPCQPFQDRHATVLPLVQGQVSRALLTAACATAGVRCSWGLASA